MSQRSDLPFGSEFSPSQIDLVGLLDMIAQNENNKTLEEAIRNAFFSKHGNGNIRNQNKLAMNCRLGLKAYGIINADGKFTDFGRKLLTLKISSSDLYKELARHILLNLNGMTLVQCIKDMTVAGEIVNLTTLRKGLAERGVHYPSGGKHPSMMRLWLAKAGVFIGSRWQVNDQAIKDILGLDTDDFPQLASLTSQQKAFVLTLANIDSQDEIPANHIVKLAEATYGIEFPEKSLPKQVLNKLEECGYILARKTTEGRGAKPFMITATDKLVAEIIMPLLNQLEQQTDPKLIELLRKPLAEILEEIDSSDRYISGLALEALAFKLMRLLAMDYAATRLRAQSTGGAEIDIIFQSSHLVFSRWQVQCKNTSRVSLDDVAKEVGLTHFLKSNAIVMVSTGDIGSEARRYANKIMAESNLCVVMVDRDDLNIIRDNPSYIVEAFNREASHAMNLKKLDI
ncbi:restriction endonuclease [Klebsiella sp. WOUb02]|uniref:restriction endonuclease n=1 Tax=Klebsiella sp. WOUb02 TaxID=3161071 RepID=UPI003CF80847